MLFNKEFTALTITQNDKNELERKNIEYTDCSQRFYHVSRDFSKQYAHIYSARLNTFRNILTTVVKKRWPNKYKILKLCELREKSVDCIIIGTLFKLQELKPSILRELSDQLEIIPQPPRTHFVHDMDTLVLEDELQRIKLTGDCINIHKVVTGVVCAVLGSEEEDGIFIVKDVCYAGCNIQKPLPQLSDDRYIVITSGLNMASKGADHLFPMQLFLEWLMGLSGSWDYQEELSKVIRVIVAGGIFSSSSAPGSHNESDLIESGDLVDSLCETISSVAPLDLMPGCEDPTGIMLPQKPFHYCLFPKASQYKTFNRVSNPYECDIGGFRCLGTSGEPIKDIKRYSKLEDDLEIMSKTLEWRHLAPSCPDTVPCTPCVDTDPFTIYDCPAIYFSGNCEEFSTSMYSDHGQRVRLVGVPDFCRTKTVAIVNLSNMDCYSMSFV